MTKRRPIPSTRKQTLGDESERRLRGERGRTDAAETPVQVRAPGLRLAPEVEPHVRAGLGRRLGAFARAIERVAVRFRDVNGPRGGEDIECTIQVVLTGRPDVVVHALADEPREAFDAANKSLGQAVRRDLERAGWSTGVHAKGRRERDTARNGGVTESSVSAEDGKAKSRSKDRDKPAAKPKRKGAGDVRTNDPLALRARSRAHTPAAHARAARARQKPA